MTPKNIKDRIKQEARISDIIGEYVPLTKRGNNYVGLCPFHNEKTPSFSVNNELNIYHCFGCHATGDVFNFLMEFKNISFPEALREVADKYGIKIEDKGYQGNSDYAEKTSVGLDILNLSSQAYYRNLTKNSPAHKYLLARGLDEHDIHKFKLGFSPDSWDFIFKYLRSKNYKDESIEFAGLIKKSEKGNNFYDRFRNRIMFPIFNEKSNVIAFGSRVLDDSLPKYINSPDTGLFNKKKVLYGLNLAHKHFRQKGYAIITEGYFDVIACHKFGFDTAVATLGTAVSKNHFSYLSRMRLKEIYLVFDPDEAGIKACFRAITLGSDFDFKLKVILLDSGYDPMDYLMQYGREAFLKKMEKAVSPVEFVLSTAKQEFDLNKPDSRMGYIKYIFSFVKGISNDALKDSFLKRVAEITGLEEKSIREQFTRQDKKIIRVFTKDETILKHEILLERELLFVLLANPHVFKDNYEKIHFDIFQDVFCRKVYKTAVETYKQIKKYDITELIRAIEHVFDKEEEKKYFTNELFKDIYLNKPDMQVDLLLKELRKLKLEELLKEEADIIKNLEKQGDNKRADELLYELNQIFNEKYKLNRAIQSTKKF